MARRRPTSKVTSRETSGGTRKGPTREQAIENLRKAWAKRKETSDSSLDSYNKNASVIPSESTLDSTLSLNDTSVSLSESSKTVVEKTSVSIMNHLGRHVNKLASKESSDKLLKNAYGFKSLADTYHNYIKLVYPYGLHVSHSDHMSHLFQSIMPSLQRMLTVNINVKDASVIPDSLGPTIACEASPVPEEASE